MSYLFLFSCSRISCGIVPEYNWNPKPNFSGVKHFFSNQRSFASSLLTATAMEEPTPERKAHLERVRQAVQLAIQEKAFAARRQAEKERNPELAKREHDRNLQECIELLLTVSPIFSPFPSRLCLRKWWHHIIWFSRFSCATAEWFSVNEFFNQSINWIIH